MEALEKKQRRQIEDAERAQEEEMRAEHKRLKIDQV
jgi:hypothetical protein